MRASAAVKKRALEFINDKTRLVACLTLLATFSGFLASLHWLLELTCHFRVQYLAASLFCFIVLLLFRDYRWTAAALVGVVLNSLVVVPWFVGRPTSELTTRSKTLRVLLSNVFTKNLNSQALLELIKLEDPDVVILQETDDRWIEELLPLQARLPHSKTIARSDNFGIGVWTRLPVTQMSELTLSESDIPSILATLQWEGQAISLLATHPLPPSRRDAFESRNEQLGNVAKLARESQDPFAVIGDLNVTMFSPHHSRLIRESLLRNARKGFGVLPTWPTFFPVLQIPLDHCLVSRTISVAAIRTGPRIGSDHLPLVVDLSMN